MSSVVKAKCPKCTTEVSVVEEQSSVPVACASCQEQFIPAEVIAASNKKFEVAMYVGMFLVGIGLIVYMAMTGNLQPKPDEAIEPEIPAAVETESPDE